MPTKARRAEPHFVDDYLPALLAQASRLISAEFHLVVTAQGFTVSEWRVLASLAGSEPINIGQLAQITTMKQPTVTRVLDRMQARGLVERLPSGGDRRVTLVRITPAGTQLVSQLIPQAQEHERRVLEPFGRQRSEDLKATLRKLIELHRSSPTVESADD
ncbi:MAG: MarR family transcriptional regulator [Burkholderiaceae bacterium]|nr:MarR family transcriptional regulator [Burkholderiaceae bacterium]